MSPIWYQQEIIIFIQHKQVLCLLKSKYPLLILIPIWHEVCDINEDPKQLQVMKKTAGSQCSKTYKWIKDNISTKFTNTNENEWLILEVVGTQCSNINHLHNNTKWSTWYYCSSQKAVCGRPLWVKYLLNQRILNLCILHSGQRKEHESVTWVLDGTTIFPHRNCSTI